MRRTFAISAFIALSLAACGDSDSSTPVSLPPAEGEEPATTTTEPVDCIPDGEEVPETTIEGVEPPETSPDKPEIDLPTEAPTELERTVLTAGTGPEAESGDTVIVDYAGVRSDDGLAFDNSYDRGEPFPVVLGQGSVIQGWDEGLVGSQAGERVQLDIPSDLAYGETARPPIICENEDLTFVIDVRAVVPVFDAESVPTEPGVDLPDDEGVEDTTFEDLVAGDGATLEEGETAIVRYVNFRGDNGEVIETNWGPDPLQLVYGENLLPGLVEGLEGMQVGGRRAITIPPEDGYDETTRETAGIDDNDMILVVELLGTY